MLLNYIKKSTHQKDANDLTFQCLPNLTSDSHKQNNNAQQYVNQYILHTPELQTL